MTAAAKRIKTKYLGANTGAITHGDTVLTSDKWTVQRDITIIGVQVWLEATIVAASLGEVGGFAGGVCVTQAPAFNADSELVQAKIKSYWLATALTAYDQVNSESFMWPEGYGKDIDDGEVLSLLLSGSSEQTADDTTFIIGQAMVHYVDR
ncbi:hypothetical protein ES705_47451 [subsurface metagenome]